jgi:hypothetical protein
MVAQAFIGVVNATGYTGSSYNQTQRFIKNLQNSDSLFMVQGDAPGAATVTFTASISPGAVYWGSVAVPLLPGLPAAPATINSPTYSPNVPWFALSGSAAPASRAPLSIEYTSHGTATYLVPSWVVSGNHFDIVLLGAGGGATDDYQGQTLGGAAGQWTTITLTYGTDIPVSTTSFTVLVGAGGRGASGSSPGNGGSSTVTIAGYSGSPLTAAGGAGGASNDYHGIGPGNKMFNSNTYFGGADENSFDSTGNAPGGGGSANGGFHLGFTLGGSGADGAVWITAYQ